MKEYYPALFRGDRDVLERLRGIQDTYPQFLIKIMGLPASPWIRLEIYSNRLIGIGVSNRIHLNFHIVPSDVWPCTMGQVYDCIFELINKNKNYKGAIVP